MGNGRAFTDLPTYGAFESFKKAHDPLLLSAYGEACPICLSAGAEKAIAAGSRADLALVKVSVDRVPELERRLQIDLIPTLVLFSKSLTIKFTDRPEVDGQNVLQWLKTKLPDGAPDSVLPAKRIGRARNANAAATKRTVRGGRVHKR